MVGQDSQGAKTLASSPSENLPVLPSAKRSSLDRGAHGAYATNGLRFPNEQETEQRLVRSGAVRYSFPSRRKENMKQMAERSNNEVGSPKEEKETLRERSVPQNLDQQGQRDQDPASQQLPVRTKPSHAHPSLPEVLTAERCLPSSLPFRTRSSHAHPFVPETSPAGLPTLPSLVEEEAHNNKDLLSPPKSPQKRQLSLQKEPSKENPNVAPDDTQPLRKRAKSTSTSASTHESSPIETQTAAVPSYLQGPHISEAFREWWRTSCQGRSLEPIPPKGKFFTIFTPFGPFYPTHMTDEEVRAQKWPYMEENLDDDNRLKPRLPYIDWKYQAEEKEKMIMTVRGPVYKEGLSGQEIWRLEMEYYDLEYDRRVEKLFRREESRRLCGLEFGGASDEDAERLGWRNPMM